MAEIDYASVPAGFKGRNLIGEKFERLTVKKFSHKIPKQYPGGGHSVIPYWICDCECGNEVVIAGSSLRSGNTKSCGCLHSEVAGARLRRHGCASVKAGLHGAYQSWRGMRERCSNPRHIMYQRYGGRGICVCHHFDSFENFRDDMMISWASGLTIDRIDNDGNYSCGHCEECAKNNWPLNVQWSTHKEQAQKTSRTRKLELDGEELTITDWGRRFGIFHSVISTRLKSGWNVRDAITKPLKFTWSSRKNTKDSVVKLE